MLWTSVVVWAGFASCPSARFALCVSVRSGVGASPPVSFYSNCWSSRSTVGTIDGGTSIFSSHSAPLHPSARSLDTPVHRWPMREWWLDSSMAPNATSIRLGDPSTRVPLMPVQRFDAMLAFCFISVALQLVYALVCCSSSSIMPCSGIWLRLQLSLSLRPKTFGYGCSSNRECPLCLETFRQDDKVLVLPCRHCFRE